MSIVPKPIFLQNKEGDYYCPIFLEPFTPQSVVSIPPCGHVFSQSAWQEAYPTNHRCMMCQQEVLADAVIHSPFEKVIHLTKEWLDYCEGTGIKIWCCANRVPITKVAVILLQCGHFYSEEGWASWARHQRIICPICERNCSNMVFKVRLE